MGIENIKNNYHIIFLILASGISVCFLFGAGIGLLSYTDEVVVGNFTLIMGGVLGISIIIYCRKEVNKGEQEIKDVNEVESEQ